MTIHKLLAEKIASLHQKLERPIIQGILGGQGTGKSTICNALSILLQDMGYRTFTLSIDDLYKTYTERQQLRKEDPRLIWRGPPGTHDINLALAVLNQVRQRQNPIYLPRFDKSLHDGAGDRTNPEIVENVDILLFEGWFVGVRPIEQSFFNTALPPIITDADRAFARDMNNKLQDYLPLWERLDSLFLLHPIDYRLSLEWRKQAERQMIASGKSGMSDKEIEEFVYYFWRSLHPELFIEPLAKSHSYVDFVIEINADHSLVANG